MNIGDTLDYEGQAAIVLDVHDDGAVDLRLFGRGGPDGADRTLAHVEIEADADDQAADAEPAPAADAERQQGGGPTAEQYLGVGHLANEGGQGATPNRPRPGILGGGLLGR